MELSAVVADAGYVLSLAQIAITTASNAAPFVETAYNLLVNKATLTDAQRATLLTQETALRAQLDATTIPADAS